MGTIKSLNAAKKKKEDEYYTQLDDISNELRHYEHHFKDKIVFCNCDDPEKSNFWKYFALSFEYLGLKKLIATHYIPTVKYLQDKNKKNYAYVIEKNSFDNSTLPSASYEMAGNGDFRSQASIELLKEADIVVTNPPFSLLREYIAQLMEYKKKFLIIGNQNAITYNEIFPLIKNEKMWLGVTPKNRKLWFKTPDGTLSHQVACWFTNLRHDRINRKLLLYKSYYKNKDAYPKYDNYDAINVDKTRDIPKDYDGPMGVPVSFMTGGCYTPVQFKILGKLHSKKTEYDFGPPDLKGKRIYVRLVIQKRKEETNEN